VYFNGGEPLLTKEHLTVLKKIDKISDVDISYNTNGSCYPTAEVIDLWSKAKKVSIYFSIDGIGKRFEETRTPLKWNLVSENIKKINLLDNINIQCSYVIGRHNVYDLEDTINWFSTLPKFDPLAMFQVHNVNSEHKLDLNQASAEEKELFKKELYKFNRFHWYDSIVNYII
jgi:MoaA/NifB/PqqE/SkfB family radical SAM enzyme